MPRFAVIIPAAGRSTRFGGAAKKPFIELAGAPIWLHSVRRFRARPDVGQIILVLAAEDQEDFRGSHCAEIDQYHLTLASGGAERFESVANALSLLSADAEFVAVHDAARPCVSSNLIDDVFARRRSRGPRF